jgi:colicin import membrane protein
MTSESNRAFVFSAGLHAAVAAILLLTAYAFKTSPPPTTKIFELVAGEGDNYNATVAPALGEPGGVKLAIPKPPTPKAEPPTPAPPVEAAKPEPSPMTAVAPPPSKKKATPPPPKAPEKKPLSIAQQIRRKIWAADSKEKAKAEKDRQAEAKRLAKEKADAAKAARDAPKVAKLNPEGIKSGVTGGSTANTKGGGGGNALVADEGTAVERYVSMLQDRLQAELQPLTASLEDGLRAEAEVHILPDGRLTRERIMKSSGNDDFDAAVLRAIRAVRMPARPKGLEQVQIIPFNTREKK